MKKITITILLLFIIAIHPVAAEDDFIVKQGSTTIDFDDIDGYAYKIPEKDREEFFSSLERINKTLAALLNMKKINEYGKLNNLIDEQSVEKNIDKSMLQIDPNIYKETNIIQKSKVELLRNFIKLEETYKDISLNIAKRFKLDSFQELANEIYSVNNEKYKTRKSRDVSFISYIYNDTNVKEQIKWAKIDLQKLKNKEIEFSELSTKYKNNESTIEVSRIKNFLEQDSYKAFSKKIFSINDLGVFPKLLNFNNRIIIINTNKIIEAKIKPFKDVKNEIMEALKKKKVEDEFGNILSTLTKEEIIINDEKFLSLQKRYKK